MEVVPIASDEQFLVGNLFAPRQGLSRDDRQLIRVVLKAARNIAVPTDSPTLSPDEALAVLELAFEILSQDPRLLDVKQLLASSVPGALHDRAIPALARLNALAGLGQGAAAEAEALRLRAATADDHPEAALIRWSASKTLVDLRQEGAPPDSTKATIAAPEPTLLRKLQHLDVTAAAARLEPAFIAYFMNLRQASPDDEDRIRTQLAWGAAAADYRKFLGALEWESRFGDGRLLRKDRMAFLSGYVSGLADLNRGHSAEALHDLVAAGRSIVVLQSHSGARGVVSRALKTLKCPLSLVGKQAKPLRQREGDFDIATADASNLPMQFLKLTKLQRKGQRVTRIFPDGPDGQSFQDIDLFGRAVKIGMGGSTLAFYGKAVLVFAHTCWTETGWEARFQIGPDVGTVSDVAGADAMFASFYAESLRTLMQGPLIDIGGIGGYMSQLRNSQK